MRKHFTKNTEGIIIALSKLIRVIQTQTVKTRKMRMKVKKGVVALRECHHRLELRVLKDGLKYTKTRMNKKMIQILTYLKRMNAWRKKSVIMGKEVSLLMIRTILKKK